MQPCMQTEARDYRIDLIPLLERCTQTVKSYSSRPDQIPRKGTKKKHVNMLDYVPLLTYFSYLPVKCTYPLVHCIYFNVHLLTVCVFLHSAACVVGSNLCQVNYLVKGELNNLLYQISGHCGRTLNRSKSTVH